MPAYTCIYCRTQNDRPFPSEHVMPKSLGRFTNSPVLNCVCRACNHFFGDELELFLASDTVEAILRVRHGVGTRKDAQKLRKTRLTIKVTEQGDWHGARLELQFDASIMNFRATPFPQVAFKKKVEPAWHWFLESDLKRSEDFEQYRTDTETRIFASDVVVFQRLLEKLKQIGIDFHEHGKLQPPETHSGMIEAWVESTLDDTILRAVGKIAFNYLALSQGAEFALRDDFDQFRMYVRHGKKPPYALVISSKQPILWGDDAMYRQTNGHLLVLNWNKTGFGLLCLVALFNHITYHALLCMSYQGLWRPISTGIHFDLESRTVSEVKAAGFLL